MKKWELVLLFCTIFCVYVKCNPNCTRPLDGFINVHLVCHTHDDVGWLKTVDQYYYGAKDNIQRAGVQYILDTVVQELLKDPKKKFIYVESAFFFRWWNEQNNKTKSDVKMLVKQGRLEFINGGWCMNDEGAAHYNAIIDQMTLGMNRLKNTFGESGQPRIAWQIDPFGHSREQASLFAQMGFDGLFFGRLDFADKDKRWNDKTLEMIWQGSSSLGKDAWLFTGVLPNGYGPPEGFCFDSNCDSEPIMDDPSLHDYNVEERVNAFLKAVHVENEAYATNNIIMTMGSDFNYINALHWYKNLDKLIKYVNERQKNGSRVNVFYSTPSCYLDALHAAKKTWPTKSDDFFPYASDHHAYWTGYFTSRPTLKGFVRSTNNFLQAVKQISAFGRLGQSKELNTLIEAMGVAQHHDAVSGTAKQHVTDDYSLRLYNGIMKGVEVINKAFKKFNPTLFTNNTLEFCPYLNISSCPLIDDADSYIVTAYNPLGHNRPYNIRLPVSGKASYKVVDSKGYEIKAQLVPIPEELVYLPGRESETRYELVFNEPQLSPLGYKQYMITKIHSHKKMAAQKPQEIKVKRSSDTTVVCGKFQIILDKRTQKLKNLKFKSSTGMKDIRLTQEWSWYAGMNGDNSEENLRASGAYIFRPNGTEPKLIANRVTSKIYKGEQVCEVHQTWSTWLSQVIRVYPSSLEVEFEYLVGPIPVKDKIGKEVVHRITVANMNTNKTFYTDANGREILKRIKDFRPTWKLNVTEPIAGNYYPVNSRIILKNITKELDVVLFNDRSQGGTSLNDGQMEVMVHRRLLHDDAFGVGEPLDEMAYGKGLIVRGKHYYSQSDMMESGCNFDCYQRRMAGKLLLQPILMFTVNKKGKEAFNEKHMKDWAGMDYMLPPHVRLLTLEPWSDGKLLIRVEHMHEKNDNTPYNKPIIFNLKSVFTAFTLVDMKETTLAADRWKKDSHRYNWNVNKLEEEKESRDVNTIKSNLPFMVILKPMQIRTFIVTVK